MISKSKCRKNIFERKTRKTRKKKKTRKSKKSKKTRKSKKTKKTRKIKGGIYSSQKRSVEDITRNRSEKIADEARKGIEAAQTAREVAELALVKQSEAIAAVKIVDKGWQHWLEHDPAWEMLWILTERDPPPPSEWLRLSSEYPNVQKYPNGSQSTVYLVDAVDQQIQYFKYNREPKIKLKMPTGTYEGGIMSMPQDGSAVENSENQQQQLPHGLGKFVSNDGETYIGRFVNGKMNGLGVMSQGRLGLEYKGIWKDDKCDGPGILFKIPEYGRSRPYQKGVFKSDSPFTLNGVGVINESDGTTYTGEIVKGQVIRGKYSNDLPPFNVECIGEFNPVGISYQVTTRYIGHRIETYEGTSIDGYNHGYGTYRNDIADDYSGLFKQDEFILGQGQKRFDDGVYNGDLKYGKRHGKGILTDEYGNIFDGYFRNDKKYGIGKLTTINGIEYEGDWFGDNMYRTVNGVRQQVIIDNGHVNDDELTDKDD